MARYRLRTSEFLATWARLYMRRRSGWSQTASMTALVSVVAALISPTVEVVGVAAVCGMAGWLLLALFLVPWSVWRRRAVIRGERVDCFSDDGMVQELPGYRVATDWTRFSGACRVGQVYALMGIEGGHTSVPRRAFRSDEEEGRFRELLAAHLALPPDWADHTTPRAASAPAGTAGRDIDVPVGGERSPVAGPSGATLAPTAPPGEVAVAFALDQAEAVDLARRIIMARRRPWIASVAISGAGLIAAAAGAAATGAGGTIISLLVGWAMPVVLFIFFYLIVDARSRPRTLGRRLWSRGEQTSQHFAERGTVGRTDHAEAKADWGFFKRVSLVGDAYVLTTRAGAYWVTPRRAFASAEAEERYRDLVTAHVGAP